MISTTIIIIISEGVIYSLVQAIPNKVNAVGLL